MMQTPDDIVMPQSAGCPAANLWGHYLHGNVEQHELNAMSYHLEKCSACLSVLEELTARSRSVDETVIRSPFLDEPHCEQLRQQIANLHIDGDGSGTPQDATATVAEIIPEQLGRFLIRGVLGTGGFGRVLKAYDPALRRFVAIKVPRRNLLGTEAEFSDFLDEARRAAALDHSHIVQILDVPPLDESHVMIVMKYIDGKSLDEIRRTSRLRLDVAVTLVIQIARAVHFAHELRFVHRDLKPSNIVIDSKGQPHVTDFGLSIQRTESSIEEIGHGGTPAYMAPEQVRQDADSIDRRTDVWALGVMLAELIHGQRPFPQRDRSELFHAIQFDDPQLEFDAELATLDGIIRRCLAKSPADRLPTAEALAEELTRWMRRHFPSGWDRWRFGWRRNIAAAASIAVVAAALWWSQIQGHRENVRATWQQLESAPAMQIPKLVARLRELNADVASLSSNSGRTDASGQFRLDIARLALGFRDQSGRRAEMLTRFTDYLPRAEFGEVAAAVLALDQSSTVAEVVQLVATRTQDSAITNIARLKLAAVIAGLAPKDSWWADRSTDVARWLTDCLEEELEPRLPLFDRVGTTHLAEPLHAQMTSTELARTLQTNAAKSLARYLASDFARLAKLVTEADDEELPHIAAPWKSAVASSLGPLHELFDHLRAQPRPVPTDDHSPATRNDIQSSRLAIALWLLGDIKAVCETLRHDPNPTLQTLVIHGLAKQEVVAESIFIVLRDIQIQHDTHAVAIKFGLLQVLGLLPQQQVRASVTAEWLNELWQLDPDSGVHSTVAWLARRLEYELPNPPPGEHGRWLFDQQNEFKQTFAIVEPHVTELGIHDLEQAPFLTTPWPWHKRRFPRRFAIATNEVTIAQFRQFDAAFCEKNSFVASSPLHAAMTAVTLPDAYAFCNWCSDQLGLERCYEMNSDAKALIPRANHLSLSGYRLPTDGEWECACRAGTSTSRHFGQTVSLLNHYAWCAETPNRATRNGILLSQSIGCLLPNCWGLFDTYGNAKELCDMSIAPTDFKMECSDDILPLQSGPEFALIRGSSSELGNEWARSHCRTSSIRVFTDPRIGFRIARTLKTDVARGDVAP